MENMPSDAEGMCSIPGQGTKTPRAAGQLSAQPQLEKPPALQLEKVQATTKAQHGQNEIK